jgi:23S rRNA pseudouridine2605 synthase
MTNDGALADVLTHPRYEVEKEYRVLVKGEPDETRLEAWRRGVVLEGERTAPAQVTRGERAPTGAWLRIVMHEGRKHEIRDIGKLLGLPVQRLVRVRLGSLRLGALEAGQWRHLKSEEVAQLRNSGQAAARPKPQRPRTARPAAPARPAPAAPPAPRGRRTRANSKLTEASPSKHNRRGGS